MKYINPFILSILTVSFVYFFNNPIPTGDRAIPPVGKVLSPFSGFWKNAEPEQFENEALNFPELTEEVEVIYDDRLVPHIFANNLDDALFVQGYIHAKFRLFQMDLTARSAAGRLSEILGKSTIEKDRNKRRLGIPLGAERAVEVWSSYSDLTNTVNKYMGGINAYISGLEKEDYPLEYKLLNVGPEKWTMLHSAMVQKEMCSVLCSYTKDIQNTNTEQVLGEKLFDQIFQEYNPKESPIIPDEDLKTIVDKNANTSNKADYKDLGYFSAPPIEDIPTGVGSNNWAVDKTKTGSGNSILCNDPHLNLTLPSIWYEMHIHTPEMNVYGVSLPGSPGIIIGFNEKIAWGMTNVGHDVADWYKMDWQDEAKTSYLYEGEKKTVEYRIEEVKIKGQVSIIDTVKHTVLGPVVKFETTKTEEKELVYRWLANEAPDRADLSTFLKMNKAQNHDEFQKAIANYVLPAQNFIFADISGDVGLTVNGRLQAKGMEDGRFIKDGSQKDLAWENFIPREELPRAYQPKRGFTSSANQRSTSFNYPYYALGGFENFRGRRVNELLDTMSDITTDDLKKMQSDALSIKAREALPYLLSSLDRTSLSEEQLNIVDGLAKWNYVYDAKSKLPSYFEKWYGEVYNETFDEVFNFKDSLSIMYPEDWKFIEYLSNDQDQSIFDIKETSNKTESKKDIVNAGFTKAYNKLQNVKRGLEWYKYNYKGIWHILEIPAFSYEHVEAPGSGDVLNAFNYTFGPSWRMVVEMEENSIDAYGVYPGGQSGNPGSKYYDDMLETWRTGEYYSLKFSQSKDQLKKESPLNQKFSK